METATFAADFSNLHYKVSETMEGKCNCLKKKLAKQLRIACNTNEVQPLQRIT